MLFYRCLLNNNCHFSHITTHLEPRDVEVWKKCTYSGACSPIHGYKRREACADQCLRDHKAEERRKLEQRREEARRRKNAEAAHLNGASGLTASVLVTLAAAALARHW